MPYTEPLHEECERRNLELYEQIDKFNDDETPVQEERKQMPIFGSKYVVFVTTYVWQFFSLNTILSLPDWWLFTLTTIGEGLSLMEINNKQQEGFSYSVYFYHIVGIKF